MSDAKQPATPTPKRNILEGLRMLERTGEGNYLTQAYPKLSGFLESALMGTTPDQMGGSVLDPQTAQRRAGAEYGFPVGLAAMLAPAVGPLTKLGRGIAEAPSMVAGSRAAQRGVIKAPGGNWLSGSVEDALKGLKRPTDRMNLHEFNNLLQRDKGLSRAEFEALPQPQRAAISAELIQNPTDSALNNFVDKQLTKYIKNDMATERDPIRALAERGMLHFDPQWVPEGAMSRGQAAALTQGRAGQRLGKSKQAQDWEDLTDQGLDQMRADEAGSARGNVKADNPWLAKVPTDAPVYEMPKQMEESLGFNHLMDELRNATNINSGLPAHLRLDPESLARVSVPQAVERVAKINDWRAAQKVAADQALANNAATIPFKEYAENNPRALRWVELKHSGDDKPFQDAVRYEGDAMGHSVGGYASEGGYGVGGLQAARDGRVKLYSLRDTKGQPHTTIEIQPTTPGDQLVHDLETGFNGGERPPRIVQIKGKGNKKPNDEYLPYVQDFVKSGKWSDVGDLHNTGLRRATDAWNPNEEKLIRAAGIEFPTHATQQEIDAINQQVWPGVMGPAKPPGYASGGSVRAMVNAAVGSSNLAKQVGNSADAVRSIAAGNGSMGDLNSLRQMAASMGYTSPGLSQAMGLAGAAKAGYNAMKDPSARNLAGFASSVNPLAAKALSIYNAVTNPEPAGFVDALASFNPLTSAWNALARAADFATLGQVVRNVNKISDPNAPAELRDMLSNNPNSASLTRNANDLSALTGRDSLDTMMDMTGAFGTIPGVLSYYSGDYGSGGDGTTSAPNGGGSFPSYSGGDNVNGRSGPVGGMGGFGM